MLLCRSKEGYEELYKKVKMKGKALEGIKQIREPNYREELVPLKVKDTYEYIIVFSHKRCKVIILNEVMAFLLIFKEKIQINYVK